MLKKIALILVPIALLTVSVSSIVFWQTSQVKPNQNRSGMEMFLPAQSDKQDQNELKNEPNIQFATSSTSSQSNQISSVSSIVTNLSSQVSSAVQKAIEEVQLNFKQLSGPDFQNIFETMSYAKVEMLNSHTNITDNPVVDGRIRMLGENRGYKKRPAAIDGVMVWTDGQRLQSEASQAWIQMRDQARKEGFNIVMTSGFRSPQEQRNMFVNSMAPEYATQDFLDGKIDPELQRIMNIVSPPGYSRHHTGYTIDIACLGESTIFKQTSCYRWASANNFAKVRQFGWIPSYPVGVNNQGPLPEEWEFVWVGELAK
jgi:LAS superfamily LD-carboxypeptidase LdcB